MWYNLLMLCIPLPFNSQTQIHTDTQTLTGESKENWGHVSNSWAQPTLDSWTHNSPVSSSAHSEPLSECPDLSQATTQHITQPHSAHTDTTSHTNTSLELMSCLVTDWEPGTARHALCQKTLLWLKNFQCAKSLWKILLEEKTEEDSTQYVVVGHSSQHNSIRRLYSVKEDNTLY